MLAKNWLPMLVLLFIIGALFAQPWFIAFAVGVGLVLFAAEQWRRHALDGIQYSHHWHYIRGFPGEKTTLRVEIENTRFLPLSWIRVMEPWPLNVAPEGDNVLGSSHMPTHGELVNLYSLRWRQKINRNYTIIFRQRGRYPIGPAEIESGDLYGLYTQTLEQTHTDILTVFPELVPLNALNIQTDHPFGERAATRRLFEDPNRPMSVRPYHPEDEFRRIHWPATARTGSLQVKVYQPVSAHVMVLCLNVSTAPDYWLGVDTAMFEHLVKVTASLANVSIEQGYAVGLVTNGCLPQADQSFQIAPGRNARGLIVLLEALAGVTSYTSAPFANYLSMALPRLPYGATLVIVTALITDDLLQVLLRARRYRSHITLISLALEPPPTVPGVQMLHLPFRTPPTAGGEA